MRSKPCLTLARSLDNLSDLALDFLDHRPLSADVQLPNYDLKKDASPSNSNVTAKLTTSAGITVTYTAPALPKTEPPPIIARPESSASIPLTWSTIEEEDEEEEIEIEQVITDDDNAESGTAETTPYQSFLAPYGQVLLDPDLDLEPQVITEEPSPDYDRLYNSNGELIAYDDDYPSSWDEDQEEDLVQRLDLERKHKCEEPAWSDIGQSVNSSFEFWKTKNKLKAVTKPKLFDTKYQHNNRYASDSNIQDAVDMTEPGLRKIPKVSIYSTTTSSEMTSTTPQDDEHVYCSIDGGVGGSGAHFATPATIVANDDDDYDDIYETVDVPPESGFFSYVSTTSKRLITPAQAVTCITVNQSTSSEYEETQFNKVTVNGKLWINPTYHEQPSPNVNTNKISPKNDSLPTTTITTTNSSSVLLTSRITTSSTLWKLKNFSVTLFSCENCYLLC